MAVRSIMIMKKEEKEEKEEKETVELKKEDRAFYKKSGTVFKEAV